MMNRWKALLGTLGIAGLCFGYFAAYVPYSMMTKMATKGLFAGMDGVGFTGFQIQPIVVFASVVSTLTFITLAGWWKYTSKVRVLGLTLPRPKWYTLVSGICLSGQIITTTLAYTFSGISIVFAMLLMRGGVLMMAPMVDLVALKRKRKIYWPSWVAAGLSFSALFLSLLENGSTAITFIAAIDIGIYLFVYFFRLLFMSNRAKSECPDELRRYFAEEQFTANIILFTALVIVGLIGRGMAPDSIPGEIWYGFSVLPWSGFFGTLFLIGFFSWGTGLFGSLIFLDKRENTFTVPANRASSVLSGVIATYLLAEYYGQRPSNMYEMIGVGLIMFAIFFLAWRGHVVKLTVKRDKILRCAVKAEGLSAAALVKAPQQA
ncbi:MAG: hypothetical protein HY540_03625 [Deltaproteobacteria bacterium]|nr:hypothetical protein [Deltaproteobacteria bacterium]